MNIQRAFIIAWLPALAGGCAPQVNTPSESTIISTITPSKNEQLTVAPSKDLIWVGHHSGPVTSVTIPAKEDVIISGGECSEQSADTIKVWDINSGKLQRTISTSGLDALTLVPANDSQLLIGTVLGLDMHDFRSGKLLRRIESPDKERVVGLAINHKGHLIAIGGHEQSVSIWDSRTWKMKRQLPNSDFSDSLAFSPKEDLLVTTGLNHAPRIWQYGTANLPRNIDLPSKVEATSLAFSKAGQLLLGCSNGDIQVWSIKEPKPIKIIKAHEKAVNAITVSNDGTKIASGSDDKLVKLWDASTTKLLRSYWGHQEAVNSLAFSPKGQVLVSGGEDKKVLVWRSGKL